MNLEQYFEANQADMEEFFEQVKNEYNDKSISAEEMEYLKNNIIDRQFEISRNGILYQAVITLEKIPYKHGKEYWLFYRHNYQNAKYFEGISYIKGGPQNRFHFSLEA